MISESHSGPDDLVKQPATVMERNVLISHFRYAELSGVQIFQSLIISNSIQQMPTECLRNKEKFDKVVWRVVQRQCIYDPEWEASKTHEML